MFILFYVIVVVCFTVLAGLWTKYREKSDYNEGKCQCGGKWTSFDRESKGGTGWVCDKCGETLWTTWIKPMKERG